MSADLPFAALCVIDQTLGRKQRIEVLVDGDPVAQLPATSVTYEMAIHGISEIRVGVHAHDVGIVGGERSGSPASGGER